jgi:hypothetical protein
VAGLLAVIAVHVMGFMVARTLRRTIAIKEVAA